MFVYQSTKQLQDKQVKPSFTNYLPRHLLQNYRNLPQLKHYKKSKNQNQKYLKSLIYVKIYYELITTNS